MYYYISLSGLLASKKRMSLLGQNEWEKENVEASGPGEVFVAPLQVLDDHSYSLVVQDQVEVQVPRIDSKQT